MPAIAAPTDDGFLEVRTPDKSTRYVMGNRRLFVTLDGLGNVCSAVSADRVYLGQWKLQINCGEQPVFFRRGLAMGRLWELKGEVEEARLVLTSFLSEEAAIGQRCAVENLGPRSLPLAIRIRWSSRLPYVWWEQWRSNLARHIPRLLRKPHLWGDGWAKVILPPPAHLEPRNGRVEAHGPKGQRWVWESTALPQRITCTRQEIILEYALELTPGARVEIAWCLREPSKEKTPWTSALESAQEYARWLKVIAASARDPLSRSIIVAGLNASLSSFKVLGEDFAGFTAGPDYFYPPRLYFRDGYWAAQVVLPYRPDLVRNHLLSLACGVHPDGRCPSGVFPPDFFGGFTDWLPDHLDAPAFFVLLLADYLRFTSDWEILRVSPGKGKPSLWEIAQRTLNYLISQDCDGDGLLEKPRQPNDWADNVRRSVWVTYDQALYAAALRAGAIMAKSLGQESLACYYGQKAQQARLALDRLWLPERGYYVNYLRPGGGETNLSIDTLTVLYFGLAEEERARRLLAAARRLQTRFNDEQPFGDWGVMCVFPPYRHREDLFGKSADPYRYHNGADWPYWDGVYGAVLREREDEDADYVLTRWWEYSLERGWLTPVEYYSPAYPEGGKLQAWSSMPAAALLWPHDWTTPAQFLKGGEG